MSSAESIIIFSLALPVITKLSSPSLPIVCPSPTVIVPVLVSVPAIVILFVNWSPVIWSSCICLVRILFDAIFAEVTWLAAMCMVSIDPVTSSAVSTLFAAKCVDVIAPSAIIVPEIAFVAISSACTCVLAILSL